jgi:flagellin-like protein
MKLERQTEEGVSPVVGVILMVAITVILAAIVATFVLGLGEQSQSPNAGVSFDQETNDGTNYEVQVQIVGMENADHISVSDDGAPTVGGSSYTGDFTNEDGDGTTNDMNEVGELGIVGDLDQTNNLAAGDKVTVTATLEGKTQVIQTYTVKDN